ncbi:hypothetical protein ACJX0J_022616, partial [Zea mays]
IKAVNVLLETFLFLLYMWIWQATLRHSFKHCLFFAYMISIFSPTEILCFPFYIDILHGAYSSFLL